MHHPFIGAGSGTVADVAVVLAAQGRRTVHEPETLHVSPDVRGRRRCTDAAAREVVCPQSRFRERKVVVLHVAAPRSVPVMPPTESAADVDDPSLKLQRWTRPVADAISRLESAMIWGWVLA